MVFSGLSQRTSCRSGSSAFWFSGSMGSPPRMEKPLIQSGLSRASTVVMASLSNDSP